MVLLLALSDKVEPSNQDSGNAGEEDTTSVNIDVFTRTTPSKSVMSFVDFMEVSDLR
jgi:hypothetical protein